MKISIITPCYNEEERIFRVMDEINFGDEETEIIIIDDGSSEKTVEVLKRLPEKITVLRHEKNKGKAEGMRTGLKASHGDVVVFMDADLTGISLNQIKALAEPISKKMCDMVMGIREKDVFYARIFGFANAFGGERAFSREELLKNINIFDEGGYMIEAAFNRYYLRKKKVLKVFMPGVGQTAKYKKSGFDGLIKSFEMLFQIIGRIGFIEFLMQLMMVNKLKFYNES